MEKKKTTLRSRANLSEHLQTGAYTEGLFCLMQHLVNFHAQSSSGEIADFAAPCSLCGHKASCNFDWLEKLRPFCHITGIYPTLAYQGRPDKPDKIPTGLD